MHEIINKETSAQQVLKFKLAASSQNLIGKNKAIDVARYF